LLNFTEVDLPNVLVEVFDYIIDVVIVGDVVTTFEQETLSVAFFVFFAQGANQVDQTLTSEPSILNLFLRFDFHVEIVELQDLSRDDISGPEKVTSLRAKLIALLGDELPKTLVAHTLFRRVFQFLEVILLLCECGGNEPLVAGVLEIDDIVRFYLLLFLGVLAPAVQDKFPQALALVLVYHVDSTVYRLLDRRTTLSVFVTRLPRLESCRLVWPVKNNGNFSVWEVHVAVRLGVVDAKTVIIVNLISDLLIRSVRNNAEIEETGQLLDQLQLERTLSNICSLEHTAQVFAGLDVPEYHLGAISDINEVGMLGVAVLAQQRVFQIVDFFFGAFPQRVLLLVPK